ncbi:uncharacterized protein LOC113339781 isoform X1 [Papaver somniferum]|uniref:uncharacterized protein LOC113339781 isoform X1 n=1 Tax=Papaver somniferum TaxID=3469 RepID=UPI000E705831|nr:uncharacterized protein LOC113339781 isoform X1 [Papaver somniferum]
MAAVEARAAWQHAANHYFVQEDAKRAPKLACCSSSSASASKSQVSAGTSDGQNLFDPRVAGFMPHGLKLSNSNLSTDTKWWLHLQPNSAYEKDFNFEQLNPLETELELLRAKEVSETLKYFEDPEKDRTRSFTCISKGSSLDPKIQCGKTEPWWRRADKDELAFLVAQKSLEHIENCDLPPAQNRNARKCSFSADKFCMDELFTPRPYQVAHAGLSCGVSGENTNKPFSTIDNYVINHETEQSKEQLMEALRHSQTRAREAEKARKKASSEKDPIIELIFKQASDLFAYNQWIQLLQLESTISNKSQVDQSTSRTPSPVVLPFNCQKGRNRKHKATEEEDKQMIYDIITKNAVAFAVGLGLVSAGLLLGWTIGWLLPRL